MRRVLNDPDLRGLDSHLSNHELEDQAQLVARGELDMAAFVMQEDAEFFHDVIRRYGLDIVSPGDLQGLIARHPWLRLGRISAGRYDLVRSLPALDRPVAQLSTLLITNSCAQRADRVALLMLAAAELPGFVRNNPPSALSSVTALKLAPSAHDFFLGGGPELAFRANCKRASSRFVAAQRST